MRRLLNCHMLALLLALTLCFRTVDSIAQTAPALSPGNWSQLSKLSPGKGSFNTILSPTSVAISGDTVVAEGVGGEGRIIAEVYVRSSRGWGNPQPTAYLSSPATSGSYNNPVAIDADTIVAGPFVYVKPAGGWADMTPTAILSATNSDNSFATSVGISDNTIVIGDPGVNSYSGAAYVYVKPSGGWTNMTQTATLTPSDPTHSADFGSSVAISGPTVGVCADHYELDTPAKAYVFSQPATGWNNMTETGQLTVNPSTSSDGRSIAVDGDVVVAAGLSQGYTEQVYVFVKPSSGWRNMTQTAILSSADDALGFGNSVSVSGKILAVGAPIRSPARVWTFVGGVYIFEQPSDGWHDMYSNTVLTGSDARYGAQLGTGVALSGRVLVTSGDTITTTRPVSVYLFGRP